MGVIEPAEAPPIRARADIDASKAVALQLRHELRGTGTAGDRPLLDELLDELDLEPSARRLLERALRHGHNETRPRADAQVQDLITRLTWELGYGRDRPWEVTEAQVRSAARCLVELAAAQADLAARALARWADRPSRARRRLRALGAEAELQLADVLLSRLVPLGPEPDLTVDELLDAAEEEVLDRHVVLRATVELQSALAARARGRDDDRRAEALLLASDAVRNPYVSIGIRPGDDDLTTTALGRRAADLAQELGVRDEAYLLALVKLTQSAAKRKAADLAERAGRSKEVALASPDEATTSSRASERAHGIQEAAEAEHRARHAALDAADEAANAELAARCHAVDAHAGAEPGPRALAQTYLLCHAVVPDALGWLGEHHPPMAQVQTEGLGPYWSLCQATFPHRMLQVTPEALPSDRQRNYVRDLSKPFKANLPAEAAVADGAER